MRYRLARVAARTIAATLMLALAAGCVPQADLPADCDAVAVERPVTLAGVQLDPSSIDVCRGQRVTVDVTTQRDGVLHLHGYDDQGAAIEMRVGVPAQLAFSATRSGQFIIELHDPNGSSEEVGILTVHEP